MDIQQVVKEVTVRGSFPGAGDVARGYDQIAASADKAGGAVDRQSKAQESADRALDKLRRQYQDGYREQQRLVEAERGYQRAVEQGLLSKAAAASELANVRTKLDQVTTSQRAGAAVMQEFQTRAQSAAGALGGVGSVLGSIHPALFAVAVVAGTVIAALNAMSAAAHDLADKAQELRRFAEIAGLTTAQVQALRSEASKFGVTADEAQSAIQAFTAKFEELRLGQGELLTQVRRVNPALAEQMQMATNAGDALTLLGQALTQVDNVFQRNALVKAATNRGGLSTANFLAGINVGALTQQFSDAGKGLDENLIKKIAQLNIDVAKLESQAKQTFAQVFAESTLEREKEFAKGWLSFAQSVRDFALSGDLRFLLQTILTVKVGGKGTILGDYFGIDYQAGYRAPASAAPRASFSDRFQPALDNPFGALKLPANDNGAKTLEAQIADMKKLVEILGPAATESQKLALRQKELQLAARDAGVSTQVLTQAQNALNQEFRVNALRETVATLGLAASRAQEYELKVGELQIKLAQGKISQDTFNRAVADFRQTQAIEAMRETVGALGGAATETEKYRLRLAELQQQLDRGKISQETFNRAALDADPVFQSLKGGAESFTTTLVDGLLDGKNFVDTLKSAFDGLAKSMANAAIKDLFSGNFEKAGIEAVIAIGAKLASNFFDTSQEKELQKAKDAWAQMTEKLQQFELTAEGFDLSGPASALRSLFDTATELAKAANAAKDTAGLIKVVQTFVAGMNRIVSEFANPAIGLSDSAQKIKTLNDQAAGLIQTLQDIGQFSQGAADAIQRGLLVQIQAIKDELAQSLQADINEAGGLGFVNSVNAALAKKNQLLAESNVPAQLINDWFTSQLQKVVDGLNDEDFKKFVAIFPQFAGSVHEGTAALQDRIKAEQDLKNELNQVAGQIVTFVSNFRTGSESTLAPGARLSLAGSNFNSQFALAQGGNVDALKGITQFADTYIKALRDNFGSGASAQIDAILNQLLALPAVQNATDPVVQALRDVQTAIQIGTDPLGAIKISAGDTVVNTSETVARLDTSIGKFDTSIARLGDVVNNLGSVINQLVSSNSILSAIQGLQSTANSTLGVLQNAFVAAPLQGLAGTFNVATSNGDAVITALRKIVYNTGAIAINTYTSSLAQGGFRAYGTFAEGGIAHPGQSIIYGEHHPQGPFFGTVGPNPIAVTPGMPTFANDNGEMRAIREVLLAMAAALRDLGDDVRRTGVAGATHVREGIDQIVEQLEGDARERILVGQVAAA